jgi:hypothetical protein
MYKTPGIDQPLANEKLAQISCAVMKPTPGTPMADLGAPSTLRLTDAACTAPGPAACSPKGDFIS